MWNVAKALLRVLMNLCGDVENEWSFKPVELKNEGIMKD